ncbi:MAG: exonuclease domain-containing protein [Oscillospiraceae bacterium]|nr:exonuclease domain-containing protein [Oscillospiraceae bacterium]
MHYIVLDLEWNQAMSAQSSVFNHLPIHLRGEIIEIGAVKLNEDMTPGDEFQIYIKPVFFRRMHYKVKKLTGIDTERLNTGVSFPEAMARFREWCGDGCTFLTWGYDDKGIMEQNIIVHDLDWDWIAEWINLQPIYNSQVEGDKNQKALHTAMEHFEIEQTRVAHDALGDAYNTALICSHLDMEVGIAEYKKGIRRLSLAAQNAQSPGELTQDALEHTCYDGFSSRSAAMADEKVSTVLCPDCGEKLTFSKWVNQSDRRYMSLASCPEHGKFLVRLKFRKAEENVWCANRILYRADSKTEDYYRSKLAASRLRGRSHSRGKSSAKKKNEKKKK